MDVIRQLLTRLKVREGSLPGQYFDVVPAEIAMAAQKHKHIWLIGGIAAALVIASILFIRATLQANVATLYPTSCLGGWENPEHAQGEIVVPDSVPTYAASMAARLPKDTVAEMYCGGFAGEIPPSSAPTSLTLLVAWSTKEGEPTVVTGESFASSTTEILDAPASSDTSFTAPVEQSVEAPPEPAPPETPTESAPQPESDPAPAPETMAEPAAEPAALNALKPIAFLKSLTAIARAQEVLPPQEPLPEPVAPAPTEESPPEPPTEPAPATPTEITIQDGPVNTIASDQMTIHQNKFMEVSYTFDGKVWFVLETFDAGHIVPATFSIPVPPNTAWTDLDSFQVRFRSQATIDPSETVLVDGMQLRVGYGEATEGRFFADKQVYGLDELITVTSDHPQSFVAIYPFPDDLSTTTTSVLAAVVGDSGTTAFEARMLPVGRYAFINTFREGHCGDVSLGECRLLSGFLNEVAVTVATSSPAIPLPLSTTTPTSPEPPAPATPPPAQEAPPTVQQPEPEPVPTPEPPAEAPEPPQSEVL